MKTCGRRGFILGSLSCLGGPATSWAAGALPLVQLVPLGPGLAAEGVAVVDAALKAFYRVRCVTSEQRPLPVSAYYPPRRRWRAEKLLDFLAQAAPKSAWRVVGITAADISTTKGKYPDWGILGLATLDGRTSVLSMYRCRRKARNRQHALERFGKVAVHELGHTFGLRHCPEVGCLMEDARGSVLTTDRETTLCPACRHRLRQNGLLAEPLGPAPWFQVPP